MEILYNRGPNELRLYDDTLLVRIMAPIGITLRFTLYSFFTALIITPLLQFNAKSSNANYLVKHCKALMHICLGGISISVFLLIEFRQWVAVSVLIGIISLIVPLLYTFIAYRCYILLHSFAKVKQAHTQDGLSSYDDIATFTLTLSAIIYGVGHVCQSFLYLGSVYLHQELYSYHWNLSQTLFQWTELFTLAASITYVYRSVKVLQRRRKLQITIEKQRHEPQRQHHRHFQGPGRINDEVLQWVVASTDP